MCIRTAMSRSDSPEELDIEVERAKANTPALCWSWGV